jgi:hypothetical protein
MALPRGLEAVAAEVIGEDLDDRTAAGLWPSDHAEINRHAAPGVPIAGERSGRFSASAAGTIRLLNISERHMSAGVSPEFLNRACALVVVKLLHDPVQVAAVGSHHW